MKTRNWRASSWYRVAGFRPRLRAHVRIHRHLYRGKLWFVLQDRLSGRFHRFTPETYRLVCMMDGSRTLEDIWDHAVATLEIDAVTQDELVRLVGQLYSADVLSGDVPSDIIEISERGRRQARQTLIRSVLNPLALRLPVFDPEDFLRATYPLVRPFLSWFGLALFACMLGWGVVTAALNWGPLTENVLDRTLARDNILLLLLAYPFVKAFHELGHAYFIKRWGGEVHEIGIMFLVFMPVPYVDASDSIGFPDKWRRAAVCAAGILVELLLAAIAMIVWAHAEEGILRALAFNVMLIGGISTLLFNGNPLLRFDGYYALCDILEIPNLGQRSNRYLGYLIQRHGFGMDWAESPATGRNEPFWFVAYACAAWVYRFFIMVAIVGLVATRFFFIGVMLAVWALFLMLLLPLIKGVWWLFTSPALRRHRGRAFAVTGGALSLVLGGLLFVPVPQNTIAEGVVIPRPGAFANATWDGQVREVLVPAGAVVGAGTPLLRIDDPLLLARRAVLEARISELARRLAAEAPFDQIAVRIMEEELEAARADLSLTDARIAGQTVTAGRAGRVILPRGDDLEGSFARRGDQLAVVDDFRSPAIRVVVPEIRSSLVRNGTRAIEARFSFDPATVHPAHLARSTPVLSRSLPSMALAREGGGRASLDPGQPRERLQTFEPMYQLDLELEDAAEVPVYGARVHVRFAHDPAPLAGRIYRAATRVFLKYFVSRDATA
ncbi:efflux RND transporter periplasmic adaptor subunit [Mangrovicoccus sp. HB161399]|uniref:efflux RND transporter periplasmic adaptor subunit n=1 Tax=Mangrovicoccus sp. HB161399 TaxID=2720392 RepID=UPI00155596FC|nr:efflux RND transporter periplasmic adaptor subunit [Mangrovicoccus sp. HB161399]